MNLVRQTSSIEAERMIGTIRKLTTKCNGDMSWDIFKDEIFLCNKPHLEVMAATALKTMLAESTDTDFTCG